ncbi:MAG: MoxR family ATPase [Candidatus Brocadiaceae bacterium]|nr:MoxR family ATPase [Candidatus Brocadiaceae bacterium]
MESDIKNITERVKKESDCVNTLMYEVGKVIVGQKYLIERLLIGILSNGHVLLEGVPGLAKTLSVMTLSNAMQTSFQRIQFTPDLLPADLIGTLVYNPKNNEFTVRKGPIFTNIVLADEINRSPAKVQSALLEAMQDRQVTIGDQTFPLEDPFLVLATQNPIEHEGTYPLPEAQLDRFIFKLNITYPDKKEEREILERMATTKNNLTVNPVISPKDILRLRTLVDEIYIDDKIKDYIIDIVFASRDPKSYNLSLEEFIEYGASPRATINLALAAKAHAFIKGRGFVTPQDIKSIGLDVLRHRIIVTYEAEAEEITPDTIIQKIFDNVEVP